jgi:Cu-processing system permease protein
MSDVLVVAAHALRESLRRRVFAVVVCLTLAFGALYAWGADQLFQDVTGFDRNGIGLDARTLAAATLLGLAMFGTLFLGVVLAVFLTLGAVRGDAERGLLQPLLVRPLPRATFLLGRFAAAASVCAAYVIGVFLACAAITDAAGGWWPDRVVAPAVELGAAMAVIVALSLAGSVVLSSVANGIAVFMLFGAGLVAGLLGSIGHALNSHSIKHASTVASWALPFEALYQDGLRMITESTSGLTGFLLQLGPFGGAYVHGWGIRLWAGAYLCVILGLALAAFRRRNL